MRVNVIGFGPINFPDSMSESDVRKVLKQFEAKKDDSTEKLLKSIDNHLSNKKPTIVTEPKIVEVEKQTIIPKTEIKTIEIEKVIEKPIKPTSWSFNVQPDGDGWHITAQADG